MTDTVGRLKTALADRYRIERELGRGGMATVYLAEDLKHQRKVALKVLRPELAASLGAERFLREIRTAAQLTHPNVLPLHDSGEADGALYYTMPYVEGESLRDRLNREKQLSIEEALQITGEVADALGYAHEQGIIHRDIKPENILLQRGHAVVADFGIARAVSAVGAETLTETGLAVGTPAYMSPEQGAGSTDLDGRSDLYSLGCVLYEMLAGETPHLGNTPQAIIARKLSQPAPPVSVVRTAVPAAMEAVLTRVLATTPADRYPTAADFHAAIRQAESSSARPAAAPRRISPVGLAATTGIVVLIGLGVLLARQFVAPEIPLDARRVMVFPLVVSTGGAARASLGEDIATMIGNSLDGVGSLRWIDGWGKLDPARRDDVRLLSAREARLIAREESCRYYVSGRVIERDTSSVQVVLVMYDVHDGAEVVRASATAPIDEPWRGANAVNELLPALIPGTARTSTTAWDTRPPTAIASFLLGEAAFRRVRLAEALDHYRAAVAADSSFALAALRGAQVAQWRHRNDEAAALIEVAARQPLSPRDAAFVRGYRAYLAGLADSAIAAFRASLALDDQMAATWLQLGEAWTHLLPEAGVPDDSALAAFEQVIRIDSTAANALFHLIEGLLRRGEVGRAEPLLARFRQGEPEPAYADQLQIMFDCVRHGPEGMPWSAVARDHPFGLLAAASRLIGAGRHTSCATAGFAALLQYDTTAAQDAENRRFFAVLGLHNALLMQGREAEARAQVDSFVSRWGSGSSIFLLAAPVYAGHARRAREVAQADAERYGPAFARLEFSNRLWEIGMFEASTGRSETAAAVARELAGRAERQNSAHDSLLAVSLTAHIVLALGDTAGAVERLEKLLKPTAPPDVLRYDEAEPRGAERLTLARLLVARGEYQRAIDIANILDSSWPAVFPLYLRPSLQLRADAAAALGDTRLESQFRRRLQELEGQR